MRIAQVQRDIFEFRREIVVGGENPRTGTIVAEKVVRYFEEKLRSKVRLLAWGCRPRFHRHGPADPLLPGTGLHD